MLFPAAVLVFVFMWWWFEISGNHRLALKQRDRIILFWRPASCLGDNTRCFLSINSHSRYTVCTTSKCNATFAVVFSNVFLFDLRCAGKKSMRHEDKGDKKRKVRRPFFPRVSSWRSCFCFSRFVPFFECQNFFFLLLPLSPFPFSLCGVKRKEEIGNGKIMLPRYIFSSSLSFHSLQTMFPPQDNQKREWFLKETFPCDWII